jgi:hypothetical protein
MGGSYEEELRREELRRALAAAGRTLPTATHTTTPATWPGGQAPEEWTPEVGARAAAEEDRQHAIAERTRAGDAAGLRALAPPTPTGEALAADLQDAAAKEQGGFLRRLTHPGEGLANSPGAKLAAAMGVPGYGDGPASLEDIGGAVAGAVRRIPGVLGIPGADAAPQPQPATVARTPPPMDDAANALVSMAKDASAPPPSARAAPSVGVGRTADVRVPNVAVAQGLGAPSPGNAATVAAAAQPSPLQLAQQVQAAGAPPAAAPVPDPLQLALEASRRNRFIAGLTRAGGAMIGRGTGPGYDALDENADRPLADLALTQADAARKKAAAATAQDADPNSPQSRMAREFLASVLPGMAKRPEFAGASYATLSRGPLAKFLEANVDLQKERIRAQGEIDKVRAKGGGRGGLTPAQELQREKFDQSLVEKATKDAEGASELSDSLNRLEGALKGGDLPGVGRVVGRLASWGIGSDEGIQLRTDLAKLGNIILRARSGAAVTPSEAERAAIETGTQPGASEQQVQIATKTAVDVMRRAERNLRAKYPGRTWETIQEAGGWAPGATGAPTSATAPAKIRVTNGTETFEIDAADLKDAAKEGFRPVQ